MLAVFAFATPLPIPCLTFMALLATVFATWDRPLLLLLGGIAATSLLTLILGPTVISSSSGPFVMPWWASSYGRGTPYVWQYALACALGVLVSFALSVVASYRRNK